MHVSISLCCLQFLSPVSQFSKCRSSASSRRFIPRYFIFSDTMLMVKVSQTCPTLCDPMDSIAHGILQARILEWVAFSFSRGSPQPRNQTQVSRIAGGLFTSWATREAQEYWSGYGIISWIFLPAISLLVYRNAKPSSVLILYLVALLY